MKRILEGRENTILKLNKVLSMGYIPSRSDEDYSKASLKSNSTFSVYQIVNCFEHACFNLTNKQLVDGEFDLCDRSSFIGFYPNIFTPKFIVRDSLFNFVEATGLKVQRSHPCAKLKNNEWLVSLYFGYNIHPDYHFFIKEKNGLWSGKKGFSSNVEIFEEPPKRYDYYDYYNTYKISNPFATVRNNRLK